MSYFGAVFGAALGDPDKHLSTFVPELVRSDTALRLRLQPATGFGNAWYSIYINATLAATVYLPEGLERMKEIPTPGAGAFSVRVLHQGMNPTTSMLHVTRSLENTAQRVTCVFDWDYEIVGTFNDDGTENSSLVFSALSGVRYSSVTQIDRTTRGKFRWEKYESGGDAYVDVFRGGTRVAYTNAFTPPVFPHSTLQPLLEDNDSGVTGALTVMPFADGSGEVILRWPEAMNILRDQSDPPTTVVDTVAFNRADTYTWTEPEGLAAGTYYYRLQGVSDTGDDGDESPTDTVVVPGPPAPPTELAYASGDAAATVLSFTPSTTSGATYRAYIQQIGAEYLDLETIAATAIAGATSITLPAITGAPGIARAIVRAVFGGVEEENANVIELEYDSGGAYVTPRPNAPGIQSVDVDGGDDLTVVGSYDATEEKSTATELQLFRRAPSGSYDFGSPDATGALAVQSESPLKIATLTETNIAPNGWYYIVLKAATAAGVLSTDPSDERPVYIDTDNLDAPTGDFVLSRG